MCSGKASGHQTAGGDGRASERPVPADSSLSVLQYEEDDLTREMLALATPWPVTDSPSAEG